MTLTPADLAQILRNPDISISGDSGQNAPMIAQGPYSASLRAEGHDSTNKGVGALLGRPWRSEWEFQAAVIAEARIRAITQTEYAMLVAIPNGQYRKGQRPEAGITAGLPDLVLLLPRGGYGALFIELKVTPNKCNRAQLDMHQRLSREGYCSVIVWDSVDEVMSRIEEYLEGNK